jgi:hypothetical protein
MAAIGKRDEMPPAEALAELSQALEYALKHPSIDGGGTLHFGMQRIGGHEPISVPGGDSRCPRATEGAYSLSGLADMATLVRELASGDSIRRPARPRR